MTTRVIMKTLIYVTNMKILPLRYRRSSVRNVPSGKERGETFLFAGYGHDSITFVGNKPRIKPK